MSAAAPRYAVYLTPPPGHALWRLGCKWLGRDPTQGPPHTGPAREAVREPWRYGFHATLKAPLRLAPGTGEAAFVAAVQALAREHAAFPMPRLGVGFLSGFLALRPIEAVPAAHPLRRLADDCVTRLDGWRAAPTAAELQRQLKPGLDARQRAQVAAYGYAHVLDDWRCHFTLSAPLGNADAPAAQALRAEAQAHFGPALDDPWACDALSVFVEPAPGAPFLLRARLPLARA